MSTSRYRTMARPAPAAVPLVPPLAAATPAVPGSDRAAAAHAALDTVAPYLLSLMLRNVASDGFPFVDPTRPGVRSLPGCVIASPSYVGNLAGVDQDYIHNWTRDSALAAIEIRAAEPPLLDGVDQTLIDYVRFARRCQLTAPRIDLACFTIAGQPRTWTDATGEHIWSNQSDGPALRTMAVLRAFDRLDGPTRDVAREVVAADLDFLLRDYREPTTSLWEEDHGQSFFARSVQLRCLAELAGNSLGFPVPDGLPEACDWLRAALDEHWDGRIYLSVLAGPAAPVRPGCDPNIDIVLAALYGAVPVTDPRLLATAAAACARWAAPDSDRCYPINVADRALGIGPLLGRYPDDSYDGDVGDDGPTPARGGHPWAVSTAAFAELCYRLAGEITATGAVPDDALSAAFFDQVGGPAGAAVADARAQLVAAGDRMLAAVLFHSDHYELSEQFDATTGYEKSVANLTWSYSSFLSALRARTAVPR